MSPNIKEALEWRYAVKKYDTSKKIAATDWKLLLESLQLAPSSYGLQPFKFIVVENPVVREKLKEVSYGQSQITEADRLVVVAFKEDADAAFVQTYIDRIAEVRGVPKDSLDGFKTMMVQSFSSWPETKKSTWSQRQSYLAMGFLLETAALLKIDATPMEGFDPIAYDNILGFADTGWKAVATVALGYRHSDDAFQNLKKVRFSEETLIQYVR